MKTASHFPHKDAFRHIFRSILSPETPYYRLAILLSAFISLLTLAVPISIQMLIDQVANTALLQPVIILSVTLFSLLALAGIFYAAREYVLELFERRVFSRLASEIALKIVNSPTSFFDQRRRDDLINRYFDIMTVKKALPSLLIGLFSFLFQALIGFTVTSLYHPIFLLFNAVLISLLYAVWKLWGWRATENAFHMSEAKYDAASWIEALSHNADFFKAGPNGDDAIRKTNNVIQHHVDMMKEYFRITFRQLITLLLLYAIASAALLGLGGWLVILGELSLGQLVAAELILSAIFSGFALLGHYMKEYYSLCAAAEELNRIRAIPSRLPARADMTPAGGGKVNIRSARIIDSGYDVTISFAMDAGASVRIADCSPFQRRALARVLKGHITVASGQVEIDGVDVQDWHHQTLNGEVRVLDRPTLPQMELLSYVQHGHPEIDRAQIHAAIEAVGLGDRVNSLPQGIDTIIAPSGWPLAIEEALRLKLAAAIVDAPRLLLLTDVYDLVAPEYINAAVKALRQKRQISVVIIRKLDDLDEFSTQELLANEQLHEAGSNEVQS